MARNQSDNGSFQQNAPEDESYQEISIGCAFIMLGIGLIGVFGNSMSILIFSKRVMRSSITPLLIGLSCTDLTLIILSFATYVVQGVSIIWSSPAVVFYIDHLPLTLYPIAMMSQSLSVWLLMTISMERYLVVCYPFLARNFSTPRRAKAIFIGVALIAVAYNLIRFWEYKKNVFLGPNNVTMFRVDKYFADNPQYFKIYYTGMYLGTHFLVPFAVLIFLNASIISTIRRAKLERNKLSEAHPSLRRIASSAAKKRVPSSIRRKFNGTISAEHRTAIMMVVVVIIFLSCNTIPFVLNLVEAAKPGLFLDDSTKQGAYAILDIGNTLVVFNSSVNFLVYKKFCARYDQIFASVLRELACHGGRSSVRSPKVGYEIGLVTTNSQPRSSLTIAGV